MTKAVSEKRAARNKFLLSGLVGLSLFGLALFYIISVRRKLEKAKLEQQNQEERMKRREVEKELEHKQRELTTKILQLASKNEFLGKLEKEIQQLYTTVQGDAKETAKRISRMIELDATDEEMWTQFSKEFEVIHSDFMQKLVQEFGPFSKTEIRLISLMKMNLPSKDIANILRISENGLKKARYRLRKKMNLASDINLQSFFLTYKAGD